MAAEGFIFDLCIVGAGMIGSAAARHASMKANVNVCLIGPAEPEVSKFLSGKQEIKQIICT